MLLKDRYFSSYSPFVQTCHMHLNLSLKPWTDWRKNRNGFETHRSHPAFQECNVSAKFFFFPTQASTKRKEEVCGDRVDKITK